MTNDLLLSSARQRVHLNWKYRADRCVEADVSSQPVARVVLVEEPPGEFLATLETLPFPRSPITQWRGRGSSVDQAFAVLVSDLRSYVRGRNRPFIRMEAAGAFLAAYDAGKPNNEAQAAPAVSMPASEDVPGPVVSEPPCSPKPPCNCGGRWGTLTTGGSVFFHTSACTRRLYRLTEAGRAYQGMDLFFPANVTDIHAFLGPDPLVAIAHQAAMDACHKCRDHYANVFPGLERRIPTYCERCGTLEMRRHLAFWGGYPGPSAFPGVDPFLPKDAAGRPT